MNKIIPTERRIKFRNPKMEDLKDLLSHINFLVKEKAMIDIEKQKTVKEEKEWLSYMLQGIKNKEKVCLVVEVNGEVVGLAEIDKQKNWDRRHIGELGITLRKDIRGKGIGKNLLEKTIKESKKNLKTKIVFLHVMSLNKKALNFYKKNGFKELGKVKGGRKYYKKYVDDITMVKYLK